jgi:hypothetical protein
MTKLDLGGLMMAIIIMAIITYAILYAPNVVKIFDSGSNAFNSALKTAEQR